MAVSNRVSKVVLQLLWFCIATLCKWLKNFVLLYQLNQSEVKPKPIATRARFPALGVGCMYLLRVLIGLLDFRCRCDWSELWFWFNETQLKTAL